MNSGSHDFLRIFLPYQARSCHYHTVKSVFGDLFTKANLGDLGTETSALPTSQADRMALPCSYVLINACMWGSIWDETNFTLLFSPWDYALPCRKGGPFQGPRVDSCPTWGNELSKETHMQTKQKISLGRDVLVDSSRIREPRRAALLCGLQSQVLW